ncbi:hypothetical protein [Lacrimispora sp.]|uniref:hypothetical protein n=1 Tax=Lacrimispora sp. TaxID=2719234 RepID=UPI0028673656|nr:hypothetical protein [Lacrimispora sp.]MDR7814646.1 hypothetical protein [Lacrimispora sp.]
MNKNEPLKDYVGAKGLADPKGEKLNIMLKSVGREPLMKEDEKIKYMIHYHCPACDNLIVSSDGYRGNGRKTNYCCDCGQKLDWSKIPNSEWL